MTLDLAPRVAHRRVRLADGELHFVEAGEGAPLVLLHGGHGSWTHWAANIGALARTRRVLAPDMPGFGESYNPQPAYGFEGYCASIRAFLDALAIECAAICGFSFGTVVSALVARAEPRRITHLAMVNAPGIGPRSERVIALQKSVSRRAMEQGLRQGVAESLRQLQIHNQALVDERLIDLTTANVRATRFVSRELSRGSGIADTLREVRQPILVLLGRHDLRQAHGLAQRLHLYVEAAPHAQIHLVERANHWLQLDRADYFNRVLPQFLG